MLSKKIILSIFLVTILYFVQLSRFENEVIITRVGPNFTVVTNGDMESGEIPVESLKGISVLSQQSMWGESALISLHMQTENMEVELLPKKNFLFIFGRIIGGNLAGIYPDNFRKSFGDWTHDRFLSEKVTMSDKQLPENFVLKAKFIGRGEKRIIFDNDEEEFFLSLQDGFIDNNFGMCSYKKCYFNRSTKEPLGLNLQRILNFFLEALFGALLILIFLGAYICTKKKFTQRRWSENTALTCAALLHLVFVYYCSDILGWIPHIPDSATFYRQGILLANGMLTFAPQIEPIEAFLTAGSFADNDRIYYVYNHFWPALIATAILLNLQWLLNPLLSLINLLLVYSIGKKLFGTRAAVIAAVLYSISPLAILLASDYMNHTVTSTALLSILFLLLKNKEQPRFIYGIAIGFLCGFSLAIRPLTTVAFALPTLAYFFITHFRGMLALAIQFSIGIIPIILLYCVNNYLVYGSFFSSPYLSYNRGYLANLDLAHGANMMDSTIAFLVVSITSMFGARYFMILPLLAVINYSLERLWLFSIFIFVIFLHFIFAAHGMHGYGARYLFEATPLLFLLAGCGVEHLTKKFGRLENYALVLTLSFFVISGAYVLYMRLPLYYNYNNLPQELFQQLKDKAVDGAIIVTERADWNSTEVGVTLFDPTFKKNMFIKSLKNDSHVKIIERYPDRTKYKMTNEVIPLD